jgi:hypothetical protein
MALNRWLKAFKQMGNAAKQKSSGRAGTSQENVRRIRQFCVKVNRSSVFRIRNSKTYD